MEIVIFKSVHSVHYIWILTWYKQGIDSSGDSRKTEQDITGSTSFKILEFIFYFIVTFICKGCDCWLSLSIIVWINNYCDDSDSELYLKWTITGLLLSLIIYYWNRQEQKRKKLTKTTQQVLLKCCNICLITYSCIFHWFPLMFHLQILIPIDSVQNDVLSKELVFCIFLPFLLFTLPFPHLT